MKKLKNLLFMWLIFFSLCFSDEIIDQFFSQIKNLKVKSQSIRIETIESKISGEITFSDESYNLLKIPFQKIFSKTLPKSLKIDGYMKGKFSPESDKLEFEYLYIYLSNEIDNFVYSQIKDKIQILIPSLGIILKDTKENIKNLIKIQQEKDGNPQNNFLPVNFLGALFSYLEEKEDEIKSNIQFSKEGEREKTKTYSYNYPFSDGNINVEIFDKFYTFSSIEILNNKEKTDIIMIYPFPEKEVKIYSYLPETIKIKSLKDKNTVIINLTDIKYNKLFSESDFKIKEMTFPELLGSIYLKTLK
jgi:hypothetical protein